MHDEGVCVCGHHYDMHGGDPEYPGSTACRDEECECDFFEEDPEG